MTLSLYGQSKQWDRALKSLSQSDAAPEEEILTFLNNPRLGRHGLDIGCGLGRHTLAALKLGFKTTAIDFSKFAVVETSKSVRFHGFKADILIASMDNLPFKNGEFDFTFSWCVFNHGTNNLFERALIESVRVLRLGGFSFGFVMNRDDPRYKHGIKVGDDCFIFTEGAEAGICHYFPTRTALELILQKIAYIEEFREVKYEYKDLNVYHPKSESSCYFAYLIQKAPYSV